jgi:type I restriction enzyme M protein
LLRLRPNKELIEPLYASYILKSDIFITKAKTFAQKAVNQASIRSTDLKAIQFPLPSLSIQQQIVAEIENYQKVIDGATQVIDSYKPNIRIHTDWPIVQLGEHIEFISGLSLSIPECEKQGGVPIISMNSILEDGRLIKEGVREIELPNKKNIAYLQKGDLLFNWRNGSKRLVGKTAYFDWDGDYVFASFLLGIRPLKKSYNARFLWYLLNTYRLNGKYMDFMRQNVNGLFNREELKILEVPIPPLTNQQAIVHELEMERLLVQGNQQLIARMQQKIKDTIAQVWGTEKSQPVQYMENDMLTMAAEE